MHLQDQGVRGSASWGKSSYSNAAASCVETRFDGHRVGVRDSKNRQVVSAGGEPTLTVSEPQWFALAGELRS